MESAKSNLGIEAEKAFTGVKSNVRINHGGMTPLLQFLGTHINKPLDTMKDKWEEWI